MDDQLSKKNLRTEHHSEAEPSGSSIIEQMCDMQLTEAPEGSENVTIINKYLTGEIALDNYEILLDEEELTVGLSQQELEISTSESYYLKPYHSKKLPIHLKSLMGEANLRFARGDHETAKKMCFEIIRQYSNASEPYITLAQIFENTDPQKCLDYYLVAALCSRRDVDLWVRCAQLSINAHKMHQAIFCYTNALLAQPTNIQLHLKRIQLLRLEKDTKNMLRSYVKMMHYLTPKYYSYLNEVAVKVAHEYHNMKEYKKAVDALYIPFQKCSSLITPQMVNIMLELLLLTQNYSQALDIFLEHCNIETELIVTNHNEIRIVSYQMPETIPIDLRTKFIICAIKLEAFDLLDDLLKPLLLMEDQIEDMGDLFLDVIEVLMAANHHQNALKLLIPLVKSYNYSLAAVWLKYADCQNACGLYDQAIDSYKTVMQLAPLHVEVKYKLAEVLARIDKKVDALAILDQGTDTKEINVDLLILKIKLLKELEEYDQYWDCIELMLLRHCETLKYYEEIRAVTYLERPYEKLNRLKKLRQLHGENLDEKPTYVCINEPSVEEEYSVFKESVELCLKHKKYALMQKLTFTALTSFRFKHKYDELALFAFFASIYNRDSYHAYPLIREIVIHNGKSHLAWNLFNVLLQRADDLRHTRFMMRFLSSYTEQSHLRLLEANYCLTVGNIKIGLGYYLSKLRKNPTPLTCILLGCILLHIFGQKFTCNKEKVTKTAIALFLKYSTMRSKDAYEEVCYNLGRLYQHFGLVHLAKHYYNLVLEYDSPVAKENPNLSLKCEAAYNLHIIYKNSKNYIAARNVLMKYIRI